MVWRKSNNISLSNLADIDVTNKTNGYAIQYDSTIGKFISKALPSGTGSGATSMSGLSDVNVTTTPPSEGNILQFSGGAWQPGTGVKNAYVLELTRWGVSNAITTTGDSTLATNNSNGINNALTWASQQGYTEFIFPKGSYLISETKPVELKSFMTVNLNGSLFKIRDNSVSTYQIFQASQNQKFCRLTNGIIEGDKDNHVYADGGTDEFGTGVMLSYGGNYISIDNLEIRKCIGDAIQLLSRLNAQPGYWGGYDWSSQQVFESGGIDTTTGALNSSTALIRTSVSFPTTLTAAVQYGYFGIYGDSFGGVGSGITTDTYDCIFYNSDGTFNSSVTNLHIWDEIMIPAGSTSAKFVFHQSTVPSVGTCTLGINVRLFPRYVYIERNNLHDNRRCAVGLTGAKYVFIRDNEMSYQHGTTPQSASDIEDGYDLNQFIYFERNHMYLNHQYTVTAIAGRHIYLRGNMIGEGIFDIKNAADRTIMQGNWFINSGARLEGDTVFSDNVLYNSTLSVGSTPNDIIISNCMFFNTQFSLNRSKAFCTMIDNCKFTFDADFRALTGNLNPIVLQNQPQTFTNCSFDGYGAASFFLILTPITVGWKFNNCTISNTRMDNGVGISLPPGTYYRCTFTNTGSIGIGISDATQVQQYQFDNCTFQWSGGYALYSVGSSVKIDTLRFNSCRFIGSDSQMMYFYQGANWGKIEILNSYIEYPSATFSTSTPVIQFYNNAGTLSIDSLLVQNTRFSSNIALIATDTTPLSSSTVQTFKDNTFTTMTIKFHELANKINNNINGTVDPYSNVTSATLPTSGYYKLGSLLVNSAPSPGGNVGWICTTQGYADNGVWVASKYYGNGTRIASGGHVYQCATASGGTSTSTTPTFPTSSGGTVQDNIGATTAWQGSHIYNLNDIVVPTTANGFYYVCTTAGTSGGTEPTWKTTGTTTDNTVVWTAKGIITWKEIGLSAVFKSYGAIST